MSCVPSCISRVCLFATLWTVARQAPLSMGFSRPEHWSGLPCPPPGALSDPGIKAESLKSLALAHEKMLNITHYQRNANQNHNEVPLHASQDGCYPKVYKQ